MRHGTRACNSQSIMALTTATEREHKDEADVDIKGATINESNWVDEKTVNEIIDAMGARTLKDDGVGAAPKRKLPGPTLREEL